MAATAESNSVLQGAAETITAPSWRIDGLQFELQLTESGLAATTRIAKISLLESAESFDDISVSCAQVALSNLAISCKAATFTATLPVLGRQTVHGAFVYFRGSGAAEVTVASVAIAGGSARVEIRADSNDLDVRFTGTALQLGALLDAARELGVDLSDYSGAGSAAVTGRWHTSANGKVRTELTADFSAVSIANEAGTIAADSLAGRLELDVTTTGGATRFDLLLESTAGEAYLEPVYANFSEHAMRLQARQVLTADFTTFDVTHFDLQQESLLNLSGEVTIALAAGPQVPSRLSGTIAIADAAVASVYSSLLQVALAGTVLGDLETAGRISGSVVIEDNEPRSARLQLADLVLDDRGGRFAVYGLGGSIDWPGSTGMPVTASQLHWDSALAYNIAIDAAAADFRLGDNDIELLSALRLPTMGGALLIKQLVLKNYGTPAASGLLDAELEPVRIGQLAGAFGWPAFSGTLSGQLPLLQLAEETATIGGTLSAHAFDGDIQLSNLRIEQPFGRVPRLYGDIQLRGLDLQRITDAFSFGLIQGRLSGDVTGLQLENWHPVAMDMHFYTPAGDKSQRRISQQAVENLASVGGGGAAAILSSGLLRFFEVFAYERIGLRCVLRDGTCAMSGAGKSNDSGLGQGFYIVKGSGLPRIDVVGFRNQVSWERLVRQLIAISNSSAPTLN